MNNFIDRIVSGRFALIAEVGVNHYDIAEQRGVSPVEAAKLMCKEAKDAGAHAVKFHAFKADQVSEKTLPSQWDAGEAPTALQCEMLKKHGTFGKAEYQELSDFCRSIDLDLTATVFDFYSADHLEPLVSAFKIPAASLTDLSFVEHVARKEKPIIMSAGAHDVEQLRVAVEAIRKVSNRPIVLCHCVPEYPTPNSHANLGRIATMVKAFPGTVIGYSDHCALDQNADAIKTAYLMGAHVVEKHFTLDKSLPGNDHSHAMAPDDVRNILAGVEAAETLVGDSDLGHAEDDAEARRNKRRSIVSYCAIPAGTVIKRSMLTFKRPGTGIEPSRVKEVLGRATRVEIPADTQIKWNMLE